VTVDPKKIDTVKNFPQPKSVHEVRSFLGLANFYRRFIQNFAHIASPLTALLRKDTPFHWSDNCNQAFATLKATLVSKPILQFPDFQKPLILTTDASGYAISYVLGKRDVEGREYVIAYGGRGLRENEKKWSISERECLAVVEGIKHYHVYLAHTSFEVITDHSALKWLKTNKDRQGRLARWSIQLAGYNYTVTYRPGRLNTNADALSRIPYENTTPKVVVEETLPDIFNIDILDTEETEAQGDNTPNDSPTIDIDTSNISKLQRSDSDVLTLIEYLEQGTLPAIDKVARRLILESQDYILDDGILHHLYYPRGKGDKTERLVKQLVIPQALRNDILLSLHDSLMAGHQGIERTYQLIRFRYFWPGMYNHIKTYVKTCIACQKSKRMHKTVKVPLHPLPVGSLFSRLHVDIVGLLARCPHGGVIRDNRSMVSTLYSCAYCPAVQLLDAGQDYLFIPLDPRPCP